MLHNTYTQNVARQQLKFAHNLVAFTCKCMASAGSTTTSHIYLGDTNDYTAYTILLWL